MRKTSKLTYLKWSFFALSGASVIYAGFLMVTAKQGLDMVINTVALQAGTTISNLDTTEYDGDKLLWRLRADSAQEQGEKVVLVNPAIDLFNDRNEPMPIQAMRGVYNKETQVVHFSDEVFAGFDAWELTSEKLDFSKASDEVIVPEDFVLKQDGITITGKDMRIMRGEGRLKVLQGVHMQIEESQ